MLSLQSTGDALIIGVMADSSSMRVDKWLWVSRLCKTRTAAQRLIASGYFRLNGETMTKSHRHIQQGEVLTFPHGSEVKVVRIIALAPKRVGASEARSLYEELTP